MFDVQCARCDEPLGEPGALLFSPPAAEDIVRKLHICINCWPVVEAAAIDQTYPLEEEPDGTTDQHEPDLQDLHAGDSQPHGLP